MWHKEIFSQSLNQYLCLAVTNFYPSKESRRKVGIKKHYLKETGKEAGCVISWAMFLSLTQKFIAGDCLFPFIFREQLKEMMLEAHFVARYSLILRMGSF